MEESLYREGRAKVTDEIKRTVARLVGQEQDWGNKKKHPSRWYRNETSRILGLNENNNPSLRSYEELCRTTRRNARVENPNEQSWSTSVLNKGMLDPEVIPWILKSQHSLREYLSKPLTIREVKWYSRLIGFKEQFEVLSGMKRDVKSRYLYLSSILTSWAQVYAEREKIDEIAGIEEQDYRDLDLAIIENDYTALREYADEMLIDHIYEMRGNRDELSEENWEKIQEGWTIPSLLHNILILESNILGHSLGEPDMSSNHLRAYHNFLLKHDYGKYEEDYGSTYQDKINTFVNIRKKVLGISEEEIDLVNSVFPEYELWWERIYRNKNKRGT